MNQIQFFANKNGMHFAAVAPGMYSETICFYDEITFANARIELAKGKHHNTDYYDIIENGYSLCSRQTYLAARRKAQAATADFFGEFQQFQVPPFPLNYKELDPELMQGFLVQVNK